MPLNEESKLPELSSASTVRPNGVPAVTLAGGCCDTTSCVGSSVKTPIELAWLSVNQRFPSGPVAIPTGPDRWYWIGNSVMAPLVGLIIPSCPASSSVNQRLPSGPAVIVQ